MSFKILLVLGFLYFETLTAMLKKSGSSRNLPAGSSDSPSHSIIKKRQQLPISAGSSGDLFGTRSSVASNNPPIEMVTAFEETLTAMSLNLSNSGLFITHIEAFEQIFKNKLYQLCSDGIIDTKILYQHDSWSEDLTEFKSRNRTHHQERISVTESRRLEIIFRQKFYQHFTSQTHQSKHVSKQTSEELEAEYGAEIKHNQEAYVTVITIHRAGTTAMLFKRNEPVPDPPQTYPTPHQRWLNRKPPIPKF